jgi:hypothetical protein
MRFLKIAMYRVRQVFLTETPGETWSILSFPVFSRKIWSDNSDDFPSLEML